MTFESLHTKQQKLRLRWLHHGPEREVNLQRRKILLETLLLTLLIFFSSVQFV